MQELSAIRGIVPMETYKRWLAAGSRLFVEGRTPSSLNENDRVYLEFYLEVTKAKREGSRAMIKAMTSSGNARVLMDVWKAIYPEDSAPVRVEVTTPFDGLGSLLRNPEALATAMEGLRAMNDPDRIPPRPTLPKNKDRGDGEVSPAPSDTDAAASDI